MEIFIRCISPHQGHWITPVEANGALAVTPWLSDCDSFGDETDAFTITHIPTGRRLNFAGGYLSRTDALRLLPALAELTDWASITEGSAWLRAAADKVYTSLFGHD